MNVQEIIFRGTQKIIIAGSALLLVSVSPYALPSAYAEQVLHYKTYLPKTGEIFNRFDCSISRNLSGGYRVHWIIEEGGTTTREDYTLDEDFQTLFFRVVNVQEKTDYTGERKENAVLIKGRFKGKNVDKKLAVDGRPFYYNPKLGLRGFVNSGRKTERFWGFQNRELKVYPMKAVNQGLDKISVGGKTVKAVKVQWTVDDFRSAFFNRTYWFRPSDGLYLKQKSDGGRFRELVSEEGTL